MKLVRISCILGAVGLALLAGCSSQGEEDVSEDDVVTGASTPRQAESIFEQVKTCDNLFKDRAAFRDPDLQEGVLRWKCGDVDAVTISRCEDNLDLLAQQEARGSVDEGRRTTLTQCGDGYGQEYCEYNAVAKGNIVNSVKSAKDLRDADVVQCVFTSVHSDRKGEAGKEAYGNELASKLQSQITAAARVPEGRLAMMKQSVNSRSAADTLIADCSELGGGADRQYVKDAERQVLCYRAWAAARTPADKTKLEAACKGIDLADDAKWGKTGVATSPLTEPERDLMACTMTLHAKNGGVAWRNSDPTICARAYRATKECGVTFKSITEVAPEFEGFSMQGWTNRAILPTGCNYATIDGQPFGNIVVCTPAAQDVKNYRVQKKPLQQLCRDKFGVNVAMQAPLGALANLSQAKDTSPFCQQFVGGARRAQQGNRSSQ